MACWASVPFVTDRWPDLAVLELLVAVAECGSLGAAASRVGVSQPSASTSIARFERRLGLRLIERSPRGSAMTPEGALVVDWSRDVLAAARQLHVATAALHSRRASHLRVAASMTVAEYLVPRWLAVFRREHPDVDVNLSVLNSERVLEGVVGGGHDVGFVETSQAPRKVPSVVVATDELVVVVSPRHHWSRRRGALTAAELAATPLVVREAGSGTRQTLDDAFAAQTLVGAPPIQSLASNTAVRIAAMAGSGPAVLSELAVRDAVAAGELVMVAVAGLDLRRRLRAVWGGARTPVGHVAAFVNTARSVG